MRRALLRGLLVGFALLGTLLIAEIGLRCFDYPPDRWHPWVEDRELGYRWAPNLNQQYTHPEFSMHLETNSKGYRDEVGPKTGFRIVLLGDSYAVGHGVKVSEGCASLLEEALGVEVVNVSVSGHGLIHHLHRVRSQEFKDLEADLVVLMVYLGNDLTQNDSWISAPGNRLVRKKGPFQNQPPSSSKVLNLAYLANFRWQQRREANAETWEPWERDLSICERSLGPEGIAAYQKTEEFLSQIAAEVKGDFFPVFFGHRYMIEAHNHEGASEELDWLRPERALERFFATQGQDFLNLNPELAKAHSKKPLYYRSDPHWNAEGHRAASSLLEPVLRDKLSQDDSFPEQNRQQ